MPSLVIKLSAGEQLSAEQVEQVAKAAKACRIVAFPTDTVYGLGSTGVIKAAARRIYQIKERPTLKPLPVFVSSAAEAKRWVEWSPAAELLSRKFWPGAVTLVLKPTAEGRLLTFAEYQTVAIRVPNQPSLLRAIQASGVPWVQTSANRSGAPAITDGAELVKQFDGVVDIIIDAGKLESRESTIVDASSLPVRVLRAGAVAAEQVLEALQEKV